MDQQNPSRIWMHPGPSSDIKNMSEAAAWIEKHVGISALVQTNLVETLIALLLIILIRLVVLKVVRRYTADDVRLYEWRRNSLYLAAFTAILAGGRIWWEGFQSVITFLGLVSAGMAIALRDVIVNITGWLFLVWRRPFQVGDRIQIGELCGDVVDIRLFQFSLMEIGNWVLSDQSTGRIVHMPNGKVFTEYQANYTQGFPYIWNEIPVMITFESNWERAKEILQKIADEQPGYDPETAERQMREARKRFLILYRTLTPTVYTEVKDRGVRLIVRYLCPPRSRRDSEQRFWEAVLREFAARPDISFAYPTTRFYRMPAGEARGGP